jgi:hypothetical protein
MRHAVSCPHPRITTNIGEEPWTQNGPCATLDHWSEALGNSGFSEIDLVLIDFEPEEDRFPESYYLLCYEEGSPS